MQNTKELNNANTGISHTNEQKYAAPRLVASQEFGNYCYGTSLTIPGRIDYILRTFKCYLAGSSVLQLWPHSKNYHAGDWDIFCQYDEYVRIKEYINNIVGVVCVYDYCNEEQTKCSSLEDAARAQNEYAIVGVSDISMWRTSNILIQLVRCDNPVDTIMASDLDICQVAYYYDCANYEFMVGSIMTREEHAKMKMKVLNLYFNGTFNDNTAKRVVKYINRGWTIDNGMSINIFGEIHYFTSELFYFSYINSLHRAYIAQDQKLLEVKKNLADSVDCDCSILFDLLVIDGKPINSPVVSTSGKIISKFSDVNMYNKKGISCDVITRLVEIYKNSKTYCQQCVDDQNMICGKYKGLDNVIKEYNQRVSKYASTESEINISHEVFMFEKNIESWIHDNYITVCCGKQKMHITYSALSVQNRMRFAKILLSISRDRNLFTLREFNRAVEQSHDIFASTFEAL